MLVAVDPLPRRSPTGSSTNPVRQARGISPADEARRMERGSVAVREARRAGTSELKKRSSVSCKLKGEVGPNCVVIGAGYIVKSVSSSFRDNKSIDIHKA